MSKPIAIKTPQFSSALLHPRYWLLWLVFACWWVITLLPYPFLIVLGKLLGWLLYALGGRRKIFAARNIELCFPEKSPEEQRRILFACFENLGIAFMEIGMAWWWPKWRLRRLVKVEGLEHVVAHQGQGILLLGLHFTTLELAAPFFAFHYPYGALYRPHDNPVFDLIQYHGRQRSDSVTFFPRGDLRTMIRMLRNGEIVWYAPDQDFGPDYSVFAPYFGIEAATIAATPKLVQMGKAVVLPFSHERLSWCRGYRVVVHPPMQDYPTGDERKDATRLNRELEKHIRAQPEQYLWPHRRFKTRPPGESDLYPIEKKSSRKKRAK